MTPQTNVPSHMQGGEDPDPARACSGLRVIDASRVLAGPFCGAILADMGADVVRVEHPVQLDEVRTWAPVVDGVAAAFIAVNHSKRGIAIDLSKPDGKDVFLALIRTADVFIENYRPGTLERFGLGREMLQNANPRLVHCAVRAFPAGTSAEDLPGYEASIQAYSGVMSLTGEYDGSPVRCGPSVIDLGTGLVSTIAVLSALRERDRTGRGGYVEPALLRTATNLLNYQLVGLSLGGVVPSRRGSGHEALVPYRIFDAADGPMLIAGGNDRLWARLCDILKLRDASGELPFPKLAMRIAHRDEINGLVAGKVAVWKRADLLDAMLKNGVPGAPVNTLPEYAGDPTLRDAGVIARLALSGGREVEMPGMLFGHAGRAPSRRPPPALGEHTDEILVSLGYDEVARRNLRDGGAVA